MAGRTPDDNSAIRRGQASDSTARRFAFTVLVPIAEFLPAACKYCPVDSKIPLKTIGLRSAFQVLFPSLRGDVGRRIPFKRGFWAGPVQHLLPAFPSPSDLGLIAPIPIELGNGSLYQLDLATQRSWTNAEGEWVSKVEWPRVAIIWNLGLVKPLAIFALRCQLNPARFTTNFVVCLLI